MAENWKQIKGYEGLYEVSDTGKVRRDGRLIKGYPNNRGRGYWCIDLCKEGKRKRFTAHKLVAQAFLPKVPGKNQVNHIDGNPKNNHINNLEWVTNQENTIHAYNKGLNSKALKICIEDLKSGVCTIYPTMRQASVALGYSVGWLYWAFKTKGEVIELQTVKVYKWEGVRSNVS